MLANWSKHLIVVYALLLHGALGNQPGLVALKVAQCIPLDLAKPLDWNGSDPTGLLLQGPCAVLLQGNAISSPMARIHSAASGDCKASAYVCGSSSSLAFASLAL